MERITIERIANQDQQVVQIDTIIHPCNADSIVINYPGWNGDIDGFNDKYVTLSNFLTEKEVGAVVRLPNPHDENYESFVQDNLRKVIEYSLENSSAICGQNTPNIYLMGFSAGAGAIAAVAQEYDEVNKILLMAPSSDAGIESIEAGLAKFKGEVYITIGEHDEIVGKGAGQMFYDFATSAKSRELVVLPNCDHQFRGEVNGMIMSKAPLWAFEGDKSFPSPEGGVKLY